MEAGQPRRIRRPLPELIEQLGVRVEIWRPGRVVLSPVEVAVGSNGLEILSEVAIALGYVSVFDDDHPAHDVDVRVALIALRTRWAGSLRAITNAVRCPRRGWLLDVEVRGHDGRLISTAFAYAGPPST